MRPAGVTNTVDADVDADGVTLGIEFVDADECLPFLRDRADDHWLAPEIRARVEATAAA